ncbi:DUF4365 domain-containing protein [Aeromonas veronii]|uniref:DUF4365 domain-containing protein n=1 Tax=Aeromonas veronii TaxID=654 RepID=UPI003D1D66F4
MNAGEIGTEAGRIFEYNLPSSWIFRSQEDQNDFGIDGEIELKDESGKALGKESVFKVQIKGEENSTYINDGKILSFNLKMERLKYYLDFKVSVVLVVVEISSEKIFWLMITNNEALIKRAAESENNESIQVHLPIDNYLIRKNTSSANKMLMSVVECWDYLNVKGLQDSIKRYPIVNPSTLSKKIDDIGDALFKAYHQQLNNYLFDKNFHGVYQKAAEICLSPIVPAKDRFVALLYYWQAFQIAPFTNVSRDILYENYEICHRFISLAREQKSRVHRLIAIGKARRVKFKLQLDQLHAIHNSISHFEKGSFEHAIFNNQTQQLYHESCISLQKCIELCHRLTRDGQYNILSDFFIDIYPSILIFTSIHEARGTKESIDFLGNWHKSMAGLVMTCCVISKDFVKIEQLYYLVFMMVNKNHVTAQEIREVVISNIPDMTDVLDGIERAVQEKSKVQDFYSISIEEQQAYFINIAKNLGMDPDDQDSEFGRVVDMGLKNYDPTNIMKNCEHLFVHYRPGGIIAQSLRMHSVGGLHLLVCLKHGYAQGTGNLLTMLYDDSDGPNLGYSFKQQHCIGCSDCKPRAQEWSWSLKWYESAVKENMPFLSKYKF